MARERNGVVVVGSGTRFISGISYYTYKLVLALAEQDRVGVILMRRIIPRALYPGRVRVGKQLTDMAYPTRVKLFDGVDWFWGTTIVKAVALLVRMRPATVIFQWWTGAVLHTYVTLAVVAKLLGARIVIEFHEVQDTGEARVRGATAYVNLLVRMFTALSSGSVIHSESDRAPVSERFGIGNRPLVVIPLGPFDQYHHACVPSREAPNDVANILFFGTIRPYKGLEDLLIAFNSFSPEEVRRYWLTVVGETWENWTLPAELIEQSPHRNRITFVNRYVADEEAAAFLAGADAVALPYRRSSASGPLHVAMSSGLPVVVTAVGGLPEAASGYKGAIFVPPENPPAIRRALDAVLPLVGRRFDDPHSWAATTEVYRKLLSQINR